MNRTHQTEVTLAHDWLTGMRGGEKVLEQICRLYPQAPLYTLLCLPDTVTAPITNRTIHTSFLQHLPFAAKKYRNYLPLFPLFAETNKVRHSDLVISTSHAVAKSMISRRRGTKYPIHICYIHAPMRYVWDRFDDYFGSERVGWFLSRFFFKPLASYLRIYDRATVHRVDQFVANSTYVASLVRRHYGRGSIVLPPPVNVDRFLHIRRSPEDWYLIVSALVPYKKVDHAIRAAASLGKKLIIVGKGPEQRTLTTLASQLKAAVTFAGSIEDAALSNYYSRAKALLFPGVEDFGIVPLEAIASGCPVIALAEGGVLDSMTTSTAFFYHHATTDGLIEAIRAFERYPDRFNENTLRSRAEYFSEEQFLSRFNCIVEDVIARHTSKRMRGILPS